ncbi:ABC transporter A family member [Acrasis kona]|uniref:ABC transporter A family member n=1 Tax=Acrasis kona TaxID=1008807 RepID=A0AAW2ZPJ2_9EUKA
MSQFRALLLKQLTLQSRQKKTLACQTLFPIFFIVGPFLLGLLLKFVIGNAGGSDGGWMDSRQQTNQIELAFLTTYTKDVSLEAIGHLYKNKSSSGFLAGIPQSPLWSGYYPHEVLPPVPDDTEEVDKMLFELFSSNKTDEVIGAIHFEELSKQNIKYTAQGKTRFKTLFGGRGETTFEETTSTIMNWMTNAFLKMVNPQRSNKVVVSRTNMPEKMEFKVAEVNNLLTVLTISIPLFLDVLVYEKIQGIREMMKLSGLKMRNYWMFTIVYDIVFYLLFTCVIAQVTSMVTLAEWALYSNFLLLFLFYVCTSVAIIGFTIFLSSVIKHQLLATVVAYSFSLLFTSAFSGIDMILLQNSFDYEWLMLFPLMGIASSSNFITQSCTKGCLSFAHMTTYNRFTGGLLFMVISGILFGTIGLYLDAVLPSKYGVRSHPLFPIKHLIRYFKKKSSKKTNEVDPLIDETSIHNVEMIDEDVLNEYNRSQLADENQLDPQPVIIKKMSKFYGDKKALDNMSLVVDKGECLGLLGPNGAGKTTIISVLVGLYAPSSGTSYVNGYDIKTDMDIVQQHIGLCPQHEILWGDLTCEEHLLFYARLKNVPRSQEKSNAADAMREVGLLDEKSSSLSSTLSGGQKKRLAIAMSMVGNPSIILLDEPTTGLDPTSRRQIWEIISKAKVNRCIILTTHSLEEADILSDRIAIMSNGSLKCIGTSMHLKNKFGSGYRLAINYSPPDQQKVDQFIIKDLSNGAATINSVFSGNTVYDVPKNAVGKSVSHLFSELEKNKKDCGIIDWSFGQSTLEDVFMTIVNMEDEQAIQVVNK